MRLLLIVLSIAISAAAAANPPPKPAQVVTHTIEATSSATALTAVGTLLADEYVMIRPEITGRVVALDFREGAPVAKGQVLVRLDDSEHQARIRQVEAEIKLLADRLSRAESLQAQQFVSEQAVIDARQNLLQAQARLDETRAALAKTRIRAPFSGVTGLRLISPGAFVNDGQDIVSLSKVDRLKLDARIPELHLGRLSKSAKLSVSVDAWPERHFNARVQAIDSRVDPASRSIQVRAAVDNPGGLLKPGMFARVNIELPANAEVRIPEQAIVARPGKFMVYRVQEGKAKPVTVRPGARSAGWVTVSGELKPGDVIVTEGQLRLKPDAPVQPVPAQR